MALSDEEIRFRERMAEFIGTITTSVKHVRSNVEKIEANENTCQKEIHSRINKLKDDYDNKIQIIKDESDKKIQVINEAVNKINTTIEVTKAQIAAYGAVGGILVSVVIWLVKLLTSHYIK